MHRLLQNIISHWEHCLLCLALMTGFLLCAAAAFFFQGELEEETSESKLIAATRYFPWDERPRLYLKATVPSADKADPFAKSLVSTLEKPKPPEPPKKVEPPKPPEPPKKVEPPKPPEPPKKVDPPKPAPKPEPKKVEPPKPPHLITINYRGYYTDLAGRTLAMLTITDSETKKTQNMRAAVKDVFLDIFTLADVNEDDITIQTKDGQLKTIRWAQSFNFEVK